MGGSIFIDKADVSMFFILVVMMFTDIFVGRFNYAYYNTDHYNREWYTRISRRIYGMPPTYIFPIVWTLIYIMLIISLFIYYRNQTFPNTVSYAIDTISILFVLNIMANKMYTYFFFKLKKTIIAMFDILFIILTGLVIVIIFAINSKWVEFGLFLPYIIWSTYALYLNIAWIYYERTTNVIVTQ